MSRQYSAEHGGDSYYRQNQPDQSDSFDTHEYLNSIKKIKSSSYDRYFEEYRKKYAN